MTRPRKVEAKRGNPLMPERSYQTWGIHVPGQFRRDTTYLDLETWKVPAGRLGMSYVMQNGEKLKQRWQAFLAGVSGPNRINLVEMTGSEEWFLLGVRNSIDTSSITYAGTRQFDEMIMKGRFTNARRAHEPVPYFPALPNAEEFKWRNIHPVSKVGYTRAADVESKDVPAFYRSSDSGLVLVHCLRDVAELILADGIPDDKAEKWLLNVLTDNEFATWQIFGGDE